MISAIKYLERKEIDIDKWNNCIASGANTIIYAYSYYLDVLANQKWNALILNDYEAVMPLPWKKKWGIPYLYQPYFANSLGILGKELPHTMQAAFISAIPKKFVHWDLDLNQSNILLKQPLNINIKKRNNQFIELNRPYDQLVKTYSRLANRKIKKSLDYLHITSNVPPERIINLYRRNYKKQDNIPASAYDRLEQLCKIGLLKGQIKTFTSSFENGDVASFYLLMFDQRFVYSLLGGSTEKGKKVGAFYLLTDIALREFSNSKKIFRFEGSDIPGIAFFNRQFGTNCVSYCHLTKSDLHWPISLLKNINDKIKKI